MKLNFLISIFLISKAILFNDSVKSQQKELNFDHITIEDGLSNSSVQDIFQDSKGYMWFATFNGLNRYDGYDFKVYYNDMYNPNSLSISRISSVKEDKEGEMIVTTWDAGLCVFNYKTGKFTRYQSDPKNSKSIPSNSLRQIIIDKDGKIWLASLGGGLIGFDKKNNSFKSYFPEKYKGSRQVTSLFLTKDNQIIVPFNDEGVFSFNPANGKFTRFEDNSVPTSINRSVATKYAMISSDNFLWIGTEGDGVYMYDIKKQTSRHYLENPLDPNAIGNNVVRDIIEDSKGEIWLATDGGGLNHYNKDNGHFEMYKLELSNNKSLSTNQLYKLFIDKTGNFWIGTYSGGINIYNPQKEKFKTYKPVFGNPNSLSYKSVLSIVEDSEQNVWIGTDGGGVNIYNPEKYGENFVHIKNQPNNSNSLISNIVKSIYPDREGNIWFGTYLRGLDKYNPKTKTFTHYTSDGRPNSLPTGLIWAILEDSHDNLWVSCLGAGVCKMDRKKGTFKTYRPDGKPGSISQVNIMVIMEDKQGRVWMGTEGGGLNLYDQENDKFTVYSFDPKNRNSLSSDVIRALYQDSKGNYWIGTSGGGLNMLSPDLKTFTHYSIKDGLPANVIYGILEDEQYNLWLSTTDGLSKFNIQEKTFRNYDKYDGLQSDEFNYTASCKTQDGRMLFGGIEGFNIFRPSEIVNNNTIPPVYITNLLVFNKPVFPGDDHKILSAPIDQLDEIHLPYSYSVFTLKFTALNYIHTSKNQYAYILENFEKKWNEVGNKREATYTNLDPGTYYFRVRACNNDGIWNNEGAQLKIIIDPPWYFSIWAKMAYLIMIIIGLYMLSLYIIHLFNKQKKKLEDEKKHKLEQQQKQFEEESDKSEKEILRLRQEKLENQISYKSNELASLALHNSHKNEILIAIKEDLENLPSDDPEENENRIKKIINSIQQDMDLDENWNQFELYFDEVHENFLKRLREKYPDLKPLYIKLCAYIRMRLTSKQIASLMNTSLASVEKNRYRLREKLSLEEGIKLTDYIEKF